MPIGIVDGSEIDGVVIYQSGHFRILPIIIQQVVHQPHHRLGTAHLAAVTITLEEGGRLIRRLSDLLVGDSHLIDRTPFITGRHLVDIHQVGVLLGKPLHVGINSRCRMELVESQLATRLILDMGILHLGEEADAVAIAAHSIDLRGVLLREKLLRQGPEILRSKG